jgi:solute carrier family 25 protein 34/35
MVNMPLGWNANLIRIECRLQLQGELQSKGDAVKKYRGVFHGVKVILQNEGPRGLFRGIDSAVC